MRYTYYAKRLENLWKTGRPNWQGFNLTVYPAFLFKNKMPKGIYIRTEWHKNRCGFQKKHKPFKGCEKGWFKKGYKLSEETKRKIGENGFHYGMLDKKHSEETKLKMSIKHKGKEKSLIHRQRLSFAHKGEKAYNWKGGIKSLSILIRKSFENTNWRYQIFERDNYTCQECGRERRKGDRVKLNAHHNYKSFAKILQEFLKEYNQFSPIEDKETLVRLATKYQAFWDIDNGKTLCEECHQIKIKIGKKF